MDAVQRMRKKAQGRRRSEDDRAAEGGNEGGGDQDGGGHPTGQSAGGLRPHLQPGCGLWTSRVPVSADCLSTAAAAGRRTRPAWRFHSAWAWRWGLPIMAAGATTAAGGTTTSISTSITTTTSTGIRTSTARAIRPILATPATHGNTTRSIGAARHTRTRRRPASTAARRAGNRLQAGKRQPARLPRGRAAGRKPGRRIAGPGRRNRQQGRQRSQHEREPWRRRSGRQPAGFGLRKLCQPRRLQRRFQRSERKLGQSQQPAGCIEHGVLTRRRQPQRRRRWETEVARP